MLTHSTPAAANIPLSGRVIHVCHYLPLSIAHASTAGAAPPSPPLTPQHKEQNLVTETLSAVKDAVVAAVASTSAPTTTSKWALAPRVGHSAMISGILSLSETHEQVIVGWTGDLYRGSATSDEPIKIPTPSISDDDKRALEETVGKYRAEEGDAKYVPVFLNDEVAHGHYDGYCKTSESL